MKKTQMYALTATELVDLIKKNDIFLPELIAAFIQRSNRLNPILSTWAAFSEQVVMAQVDALIQSKRIGLLQGVPVGIKDVFNTALYPTQKGSAAWKGYCAGNDARSVGYLKNEGAIVFAKTDTAELAVHANGKARNPHGLMTHVTGSSSGGSAAAVAAAMVPVALGTQTGGSIIRPASWCGVYAMKPSFGLIPRTGVLKTTDTLDSIGFFSRSIDDLALMLDVLRVHGDNFPIQERNLQKYTSLSPNLWRIGLCRSHLDDELSPYVHKAMADFKLELKARANIEVIDVVLPPRVKSFQALHRRIYHPCLAYYLNTERESASQHLSPELKAIFEDAATIPASDYATALEEQVLLAKELEQLLIDNQLDLMLSYSSNGSAPTHEPDRSHDLNQLWTMSWLPVVTVPHFTCPQGRPFGFQVIGRRYADYQVLSFVQGLKHDGLIAPESMIADVDEAFVPRAECLAI